MTPALSPVIGTVTDIIPALRRLLRRVFQLIYGRVPKLRDVGDFTADEHALLRGSRTLFTSTGRDVAFVAALALPREKRATSPSSPASSGWRRSRCVPSNSASATCGSPPSS